MSESYREFTRNNSSVYYISDRGNVVRERLSKPGEMLPVRPNVN